MFRLNYCVLCLLIGLTQGAGASNGNISLQVIDESGIQIPFRAYIIDDAGESIIPEGVNSYVKTFFGGQEQHILADGTINCSLPEGEYKLRIERGLNGCHMNKQ